MEYTTPKYPQHGCNVPRVDSVVTYIHTQRSGAQIILLHAMITLKSYVSQAEHLYVWKDSWVCMETQDSGIYLNLQKAMNNIINIYRDEGYAQGFAE
jgi:hypothetical protein